MAISKLLKVALVALLATATSAHPKLSEEEMVEYQDHQARTIDALGRCLEAPHMQEITRRALEHHETLARDLRSKRGLDQAELAARDHHTDAEAWKLWNTISHWVKGKSKDPQDLFDFKWNRPVRPKPGGCALTPESLYGPYWLDDQPKRSDIARKEKGIPLRLAMQVVDVEKCMPSEGARIDVWHANSTGNYSVSASSFLRGWQPTSRYGTVDFDTIFPGHYPGRATHVHVAVRLPDSGPWVHVGQVYFDQALRDQVEKSFPYKDNVAEAMTNELDIWGPWSSSKKFDPIVRWSWLGRKPEDGILAWIGLGVNKTAQNEQPPALPPPGKVRRTSLIDSHFEAHDDEHH